MTNKRTTTPKPSAVKLAEEIALGRHDEHIVTLAKAIAVRLQATATVNAWTFRLDGISLTEDEITIGEWIDIQEAVGKSWTDINPETDPRIIQAIGKVLLASRGGLTTDAATARVNALTTREIRTEVCGRELIDRPFDSPGPATT